ncbi:hypothetical protein ACIQCG_10185 [Streptomyces noursei]|nr:hypothetical protein [Streptomyces noursei]
MVHTTRARVSVVTQSLVVLHADYTDRSRAPPVGVLPVGCALCPAV